MAKSSFVAGATLKPRGCNVKVVREQIWKQGNIRVKIYLTKISKLRWETCC